MRRGGQGGDQGREGDGDWGGDGDDLVGQGSGVLMTGLG